MPSYGPLASLYDRLTEDVDYEEFANFYEKIFSGLTKRPKTILDLACGTGSLTAIMSQRGYELIAADASADMLSEAREKCAEIPGIVPPLFLCQPMTGLDLYGTVDAAYSSLDAVNYLQPGELPRVFDLLHLFIEPDGIFIFDINSPERLRSLDGSVSVDEDENMLCLWRADFDGGEQCLCYGMDIFTRRGRFWQRSSEEHTEYVHEPDTILRRLSEAGFVDIRLISDGPQAELGRLFFTARNTSHEV